MRFTDPWRNTVASTNSTSRLLPMSKTTLGSISSILTCNAIVATALATWLTALFKEGPFLVCTAYIYLASKMSSQIMFGSVPVLDTLLTAGILSTIRPKQTEALCFLFIKYEHFSGFFEQKDFTVSDFILWRNAVNDFRFLKCSFVIWFFVCRNLVIAFLIKRKNVFVAWKFFWKTSVTFFKCQTLSFRRLKLTTSNYAQCHLGHWTVFRFHLVILVSWYV